MNVNGKYLKDENKDVFSPITSTQTIFDKGQQLDLYHILRCVSCADIGTYTEYKTTYQLNLTSEFDTEIWQNLTNYSIIIIIYRLYNTKSNSFSNKVGSFIVPIESSNFNFWIRYHWQISKNGDFWETGSQFHVDLTNQQIIRDFDYTSPQDMTIGITHVYGFIDPSKYL